MRHPQFFDGIAGLHFHTNCDSPSFAPLHRTVNHLERRLSGLLGRLRWINLGGGYLFRPGKRMDLLRKAVGSLKSSHGLEVYMEPGATLVRRAGYLVATVIDLFKSDGKRIAVLDTTVNHMPEVFEYQFEPDVVGHDRDGEHEYRLVGSSCLAGDMLGDYAFARPLKIGLRVVFSRVGAYSMVKAHMFNGINLPTIYSVSPSDELIVRRRFTYDDYFSRFGAWCDAAV
jgi:carboxynorspermidine decarboxylase